jgi:hypothetical protein
LPGVPLKNKNAQRLLCAFFILATGQASPARLLRWLSKTRLARRSLDSRTNFPVLADI